MKFKSILVLVSIFYCFQAAVAQRKSQTDGGKIVTHQLMSEAIKNSISQENPNRNVLIYLPPSYEENRSQHYPVVYLLHGIGDTDSVWVSNTTALANIKSVVDAGIDSGFFGEFIVVMPDERTNWFGSFYVNSTVTGNWEDFTTKELVDYVDNNYRTKKGPEYRAVAGHSMGGYGAITLAMKYPGTFSIAYGMNPALIEWNADLSTGNASFQRAINNLQKVKSFQEVLMTQDRTTIGLLTVALAFAPNPSSAPLLSDLPYRINEGQIQVVPEAYVKWTSNFTSQLAIKHRENLLKLRGLKFDSGYQDDYLFIPPSCRQLSNQLTSMGVPHIFEEYNGDHGNRMWGEHGRLLTEVLPFIWQRFKK